MSRFLEVLTPLALSIILIFNTSASGEETQPNLCMTCHEDVYVKALSYKYQHSVVISQCPICHINPDSSNEVKTDLTFSPMSNEWIVYLDQLTEDQLYKAEVTATDSNGKICKPSSMDIIPGDAWEHKEPRPAFVLTELTGLSVDEIKKRGFAKAVISWDTNTFATSEIEYRLIGKGPRTFRLDNQFTKEHKVILKGLKHKSLYYFRAASRDIYGNTLRSEEYTIDTSSELSLKKVPEVKNLILPFINSMQVFRKSKDEGLYMKVSLNKPSELSVKLKEIGQEDKNHGFGLVPPRYSRIDACYTCHPHGASHPVGVKAVSPKIKTPDGLPTIEDGIITCVTCHEPHGGNRLHYNRFDYKKDLCMRCHLKKYSK